MLYFCCVFVLFIGESGICVFFFFQAEDGIRDATVTGVQTCALPISPIACNQVEYHVLRSRQELLEYARGEGVAITAYSPLAKGRVADHPVLARIGAKYGKSASQVALRWLVEQDRVAAIPKASSERHLRANMA